MSIRETPNSVPAGATRKPDGVTGASFSAPAAPVAVNANPSATAHDVTAGQICPTKCLIASHPLVGS